MKWKVIILMSFLTLGSFVFATEKDKLIAKKDTIGHVVEKGDSLDDNNLDLNKKGKIRNDDTLVFDDLEAPKSQDRKFVLNKKTGEGSKQYSIANKPNDQNDFSEDSKTIDMQFVLVSAPLEVYPNPAVSNQGTWLILPFVSEWNVTVIALNGQTTHVFNAISETALLLNIPASGSYIVRATERDTVLYKRLIIR